jgi:membrane peptidoglycan carboxypeptidase
MTLGKRWVGRLAIGGLSLGLLLGGLAAWELRDPPTVDEIQRQIRGNHIGRGHGNWGPLSAISSKLQAAVIVSEDWSFYRHRGLDYNEVWAAILADLRVRRFRRGGSTITQQVAKNLFLTPERSLCRKFREAILARRLEHALSKDEILEAYLNVANWGDGIVGAEPAAQFYFCKPASSLDWAESATLAAILPDPHRLNPLNVPEEAMRLRQIVLMRLLVNKDMTPEEYYEAVHLPVLPAKNTCLAGRHTKKQSFSPFWLAAEDQAIKQTGSRLGVAMLLNQ